MNTSPIFLAQQQLLSHPFDMYHDVFHHYKVWENARRIVFFERLTLNLEVLDIACWWHDVFRGDTDSTRIVLALENSSIEKDVLTSVVLCIDEHSFGHNQTHLESQVLFDADKIEYVSIPRWQAAFEASDRGEISVEEKERYITSWNKRAPYLLGKLHFQNSNTLYEQNYAAFVDWLGSIGRYNGGRFS